MPLVKRLAAEAIGTAFLLAAVIGSGIMGERLAGGNVAIALLANSIATGCVLAVLIFVFAPLSGAHFNPLVTLAVAARGGLARADAVAYIAVQFAAAFTGAALAHLMFGEALFSVSAHAREGPSQWLGEFVATFGLVLLVRASAGRSAGSVGLAVGGYIAAAYWFTSSTSFANPAVTLARAASDTFAGIRPQDVPPFVASQAVGALVAALCADWMFGNPDSGTTPRS